MPPGPAPWPQQGFPPARGPSRLPVFLALGVAVVALGLAIGAWFRPAATTPAVPTSPQYSEQEVADAKTAVCDAYDTTYKSLYAAGSRRSDDPTQTLPIAVNTRLAFHASADYLSEQLAQNPAAPSNLAEEVRKLASASDSLVLAQIADSSKDELDGISSKLDSAESAIKAECK